MRGARQGLQSVGSLTSASRSWELGHNISWSSRQTSDRVTERMKHETVCGLDIGTTKTCAVVAVERPAGLEIVGFGEAPSLGMRKGVVVDLDETIKSIEAATEKAERMAGIHFSDVFVGITGDHIRSTNNRAVVAVSGEDREVTAGDVRRVIDASKIINFPSDRQIIHALPRYFTVDGQEGVNDPVGMAGGRLEVDTHIVTGSTSFITNVLKCVQRAGLEAAGVVFEPLASSAATLLQRREAGRRRAARHRRRHDRHRGLLARQRDLHGDDSGRRQHAHQRHLARPEDDARRSRRGEEAIRCAGATTRSAFTVRTLDGRATREHTTAELRQIVVPRVLETLRMARQKIVENVPRDLVLGEVVLTGGGARLPGIEAIAEDVFGLPVRVGMPNTIGGLTDAMALPQYATAIGLVLFGANGERRRLHCASGDAAARRFAESSDGWRIYGTNLTSFQRRNPKKWLKPDVPHPNPNTPRRSRSSASAAAAATPSIG